MVARSFITRFTQWDKKTTQRRVLCSLAGMLSLFTITSTAHAQDTSTNTATGFDTQMFWPAVGPHGLVITEGSKTLEHLQPTAGVVLHYGAEPLITTKDDDTTNAIISQQLVSQVQAGIGLADRLQIDASMPFYLVNDGIFDEQEFTGAVLGDLALRAKTNIFTLDSELLGIGARLNARLPTGNEDALAGSNGVAVQPDLIVDGIVGPITWAVNLGASFHAPRELTLVDQNIEVGHQFMYSAGAQWNVFEDVLGISAEVYGSTPFNDFFGAPVSPMEAIIGVKLRTPAGFQVMSGAGGGMLSGVGTTAFRSFIGLSYVKPMTPDEPEMQPVLDLDEDGFPDDIDQCKDAPEDLDGFEDEDGCPDPDNDQDGIEDQDDECPMEAGVAELKGCPITDKDQDGVLDAQDKCIDEQGPAENEGCPWPDADADGVIDAQDKCPQEPGVAALEGCPRTEVKNVKLVDNTITILEKVYFKNGDATILEESFPLLDEVATVLREYPEILKVEVGGHTDSKGNDKKNKALSQRRAESVVAYLVSKGVEPERLVATGYGEEQPLVQELSKDDRAKNRRVEFIILDRLDPNAPTEEDVQDGGDITGGEEVIEDGGDVTGGEEVIEDGGEEIQDGGDVTGGEEVIEDGGTVE